MGKDRKVCKMNSETLHYLIKSTEFASLNDDLKDIVLESLENSIRIDKEEKMAGVMGELFGNRSQNITLYIAFIVSILLIGAGVIYILLPPEYKIVSNLEFWQTIGPIITGALGYVFGAHPQNTGTA